MKAGTLEYHQWPMRHHVGEDPGIGHQLGRGVGREGRDREGHPGEVVEQLAVVVKADPAVEQVATAGDSRGIDIADRADHQVERQPELGAELGQHPEDGAADLVVLVGPEVHAVNRLADRRRRPAGRRAPRGEVGRQADRAGPRPLGDEPLEQPADRLCASSA